MEAETIVHSNVSTWNFEGEAYAGELVSTFIIKLGHPYYLQNKMATAAKKAWWGLIWCHVDFAKSFVWSKWIIVHCIRHFRRLLAF